MKRSSTAQLVGNGRDKSGQIQSSCTFAVVPCPWSTTAGLHRPTYPSPHSPPSPLPPPPFSSGLMSMASIYWDMEHYSQVERIFRQSAEFCSEHDVWKLNVAHTYFMQDNHYKEAIRWGRVRGLWGEEWEAAKETGEGEASGEHGWWCASSDRATVARLWSGNRE